MLHFVTRLFSLFSLVFVTSLSVPAIEKTPFGQRASINYSISDAAIAVSHLDSKNEISSAEVIDCDGGLLALLKSAQLPQVTFSQNPHLKNSQIRLCHSGPSPPAIV